MGHIKGIQVQFSDIRFMPGAEREVIEKIHRDYFDECFTTRQKWIGLTETLFYISGTTASA